MDNTQSSKSDEPQKLSENPLVAVTLRPADWKTCLDALAWTRGFAEQAGPDDGAFEDADFAENIERVEQNIAAVMELKRQ